jgi:polyisoprenoid-binding protein YceI
VARAGWEFDTAHTEIRFKVKHLMVSSVNGSFGRFTGTVDYDEKDVTKSKVDVSIDASSISTGIEKRDTHLKSADFLDAEKFPTLAFRSTKVAKGPRGTLKVYGELTIRGVTKPVVLDVTGPTKAANNPMDGTTHVGATATTRIDRKAFGLKWNAALETGGVMVGDDVDITLEIDLVKR